MVHPSQKECSSIKNEYLEQPRHKTGGAIFAQNTRQEEVVLSLETQGYPANQSKNCTKALIFVGLYMQPLSAVCPQKSIKRRN